MDITDLLLRTSSLGFLLTLLILAKAEAGLFIPREENTDEPWRGVDTLTHGLLTDTIVGESIAEKLKESSIALNSSRMESALSKGGLSEAAFSGGPVAALAVASLGTTSLVATGCSGTALGDPVANEVGGVT